MIKLSGRDVTFGENTVSQSGQRLVTKSGIREKVLSGDRITGIHWNGHRFPPPESGCVLYLPGYPAQGSTIKDFSGQANNGTFKGAGEPAWKRFPSGLWVLDFDGSDDRVVVATSSSLEIANNITIEVWLNTEAYASTTGGILCRTPLGSSYGDWDIYQSPAGTVTLRGSGGTPTIATTTEKMALATWYHLVVTQDTDDAIVYFNAVSKATDSSPTEFATSGYDIYLGVFYVQAAARSFNGLMALLRIYNVVLSASEIAHHYSRERVLFGV